MSSAVFSQETEEVNVLFVVGDPGALTDGDFSVIERMEGQGFIVDVVDDDEVDESWADGMSFVYASSTTASGSIAGKFKEVEIPVIMIEPYALDDMGMTHDTDTTRSYQSFQRDMVILAEDHFLAAGLSGDIPVFDNLDIQSGQGYPSDEGILIAEYMRDELDAGMIYGAIFAYEKGALMADTTEAAGRRYFAGWNDLGVAYLNEDGEKLWQASIDWCLYKDQDTKVKNSQPQLPEGYELAQNSPNPFNPATAISFTIPQSSAVRLNVYDLQGRQVAELLNEKIQAGTFSIQYEPHNLASGVYVYQLRTDAVTITKKMTLLQ